MRSFDLPWGALESRIPRASGVELQAVGDQYIYVGGDRLGLLYDHTTGAKISDVQYQRALAADPYRPRLVESYYSLDRFTFPNGFQISGLHPHLVELRARSIDGTIRTLYRDSLRITAPNRVAFMRPMQPIPLQSGDLVVPIQRYEILVTFDSLGSDGYATYYRNDWTLDRFDASTGMLTTLAEIPGEPFQLRRDSAMSVVTFRAGFDPYLLDVATGQLTLGNEFVRHFSPTADGRFLVREHNDHTVSVLDRTSSESWVIGGGGGRSLGEWTFGDNNDLFVSRKTDDAAGVWRLPIEPSANIDDATLVWSAREFLDSQTPVHQLDLSAPLILNDGSFLVLVSKPYALDC